MPALRRLTGARLAALNHGSVRSRTVPAGDVVVRRMRDLQAAFPSEIRSDGEADPVFSLHLSDLDIEPLLDAVAEEDKAGVRRVWLRDRLWEAIGVRDGQFVAEKEIVWRGTRRIAEFVFGNVRDRADLPDEQFTPATAGNVRFVVDYPFDDGDHYPSDDYHRVEELRRSGVTAPTLVWLTDFFSDQRRAQLGRLMRITFLLERDRLADYTGTFPPDDRAKVRRQLEVARDTLTDQLTGALAEVYGLARPTDANPGPEVPDGRHVLSLQPEFAQPREEGGKGFEANVLHLADGMFSALYPKHPDFGPDRTGKRNAVTPGELRTALEWITRAMDEGGRANNVDSHHLKTVKRIVEPLELGTVHDGPLVMRSDWRARINQAAAAHQQRGDLDVEDIRSWITKDLGYAGLDRLTGNLLVAAYALLDDRAWVLRGGPEREAPALQEIGAGWSLRAQPLPSDEEYAAARDRAARLFGVTAKPALYARNVNRLADDLRARAEAWERNVAGVRTSLDRHAPLLGLDEPGASRTAILREAAGLLARLSRHGGDATALVRELAAFSPTAGERDLNTAMGSAGEVLAALDGTDWPALRNVHGLTGREDGVGDRARRLFTEIAQAARASEFDRSLVQVLSGVREQANAIINAALRVESVVTDPPPPVAQDVRVSEPEVATSHPVVPPQPEVLPGTPADSSDPSTDTAGDGAPPRRSGRRLIPAGGDATALEQRLAVQLAAVQEEIRAFRAAHPDAGVEIVWQPVGGPGTDRGRGTPGRPTPRRPTERRGRSTVTGRPGSPGRPHPRGPPGTPGRPTAPGRQRAPGRPTPPGWPTTQGSSADAHTARRRSARHRGSAGGRTFTRRGATAGAGRRRLGGRRRGTGLHRPDRRRRAPRARHRPGLAARHHRGLATAPRRHRPRRGRDPRGHRPGARRPARLGPARTRGAAPPAGRGPGRHRHPALRRGEPGHPDGPGGVAAGRPPRRRTVRRLAARRGRPHPRPGPAGPPRRPDRPRGHRSRLPRPGRGHPLRLEPGPGRAPPVRGTGRAGTRRAERVAGPGRRTRRAHPARPGRRRPRRRRAAARRTRRGGPRLPGRGRRGLRPRHTLRQRARLVRRARALRRRRHRCAHPVDRPGGGGRPRRCGRRRARVIAVLERADQLADTARLTPLLAEDRLLPSGYRTRLRALAAALDGRPGAAQDALRRLSDHQLATLYGESIERARTAVRLVRWLDTPAPDASSVGQAVREHLRSTGRVDLAVGILAEGDTSRDGMIGEAYHRLIGRARDRRRELDERFARDLATWTEAASQQAPNGALLIEDVLAEVAAPLARDGGRPWFSSSTG